MTLPRPSSQLGGDTLPIPHPTQHRSTFGTRHASPAEFQPDLCLWIYIIMALSGWYLITMVVSVQVSLCCSVCTGLHAGKKDMKVKDHVLNALEKKCCRHLLQRQKQMESESMQKQIKFIESRFKLVQSTLPVFSLYLVLITFTRFLQAARYFILQTF